MTPPRICECGSCRRCKERERDRARYLERRGGVLQTSWVIHDPATRYTESDCGHDTPCWVWGGPTDGRYGLAFDSERKRNVRAHIWHYRRRFGAVPDGLELDHLCRNTMCVNPEHLEAVTHAENMRRGCATLLSEEQVRAMRRTDAEHRAQRNAEGCSTRRIGFLGELAEKFGISKHTVGAILNQPERYWVGIE